MSPPLEEVVADLTRRVAALEAAINTGRDATTSTGRDATTSTGRDATTSTGRDATTSTGRDAEEPAAAGAPDALPDPLWALHALQAELAGGDRPAGSVMLTGVVPLPAGGVALWQQDHSPDTLLDADLTALASRLHALGSPVRLRLLREVLQGRTGSGELAADPAFGTSGQVNHHLRQLVAAGWLRPTARGHHSVPTERVVPLLAALAAAGG